MAGTVRMPEAGLPLSHALCRNYLPAAGAKVEDPGLGVFSASSQGRFTGLLPGKSRKDTGVQSKCSSLHLPDEGEFINSSSGPCHPPLLLAEE